MRVLVGVVEVPGEFGPMVCGLVREEGTLRTLQVIPDPWPPKFRDVAAGDAREFAELQGWEVVGERDAVLVAAHLPDGE